MTMKQISVLFFATLKDRAGQNKITLDLDGEANIADLKSRLEGEFPGLAPVLETALVAINREFAFEEDFIPEGAEVAFFPPVSGGGQDELPAIFLITEEELDLDALVTAITLPSTGAACVFTGMVRRETTRGQPHQTDFLEYEAFKPMAEEKMRQVADEIRTQWPMVAGIAIVQRIGRLYPGTPTVLIACTAGHRDSGVFEAARYGIDRLKEIVPIWKKEVGLQGETWVEGDYLPKRGD
jgi:molybdopterin synthase catalytic subunit